ncbi:hypothetical protein ACLBKU_04165 [Erythrobacter sp. NE805]|uniref:hypothetical protein n=1 Tax=Erythrobacter sp. NE805 TaxID=3389875 RepID=UPI00396B0E90
MTTNSETGGTLREELGNDTAHLGSTLKDRAKQEAETRKGAALGVANAATGALGKAAEELRNDPEAPEWLANGLQQVARQVDRIANDLQGRSVDDLTRDANRLARENPGTFLAVAALAGFAAARVLRAGADHKRNAGGANARQQQAYQPSQQSFDSAPAWPADENIMPTDTGTDPGFAPAYGGAEGGTIR